MGGIVFGAAGLIFAPSPAYDPGGWGYCGLSSAYPVYLPEPEKVIGENYFCFDCYDCVADPLGVLILLMYLAAVVMISGALASRIGEAVPVTMSDAVMTIRRVFRTRQSGWAVSSHILPNTPPAPGVLVRTFGNSFSSIRGAFYFAGILWLALFVLFVSLDRIHADLPSRLMSSIIYSLGIASIPLVAIVPTCAFAIRVDASSVKHVFLGRVILSARSLDDLRAVEIGSGWGAVMKFEKQRPIRFLGASLPELQSLCVHLSKLRPNQISSSAGLVAGGLLEVENQMRKRGRHDT